MAQRTTVTLNDDVYEALRERAARSGRRLRDVINEVIRRGLAAEDAVGEVDLERFAADMVVDIVSTSRALEVLEGPESR